MRQRLEGNYAQSLCSQSIKFASFNTRRKALGKAALVGLRDGLQVWLILGLKSLLELTLRQEVMRSALT